MTDDAIRAAQVHHGDLWRRLDRIIASARADGLTWPSWIHAPIAASYAALTDPRTGRVPPEQGESISRCAAVGAWRTTKSVYRYDPDLLEALWTTPIDRELPASLLHRLPEWCVYLSLTGRDVASIPIRGAYVHLEVDAGDGREELRVLLDCVGPSDPWLCLTPVTVHLGKGDGSIVDGLEAAWDESMAQAALHGMPGMASVLREHRARATTIARGVAPIVSCALYLCSAEPEIRDEAGRRERPTLPYVDRKRGSAPGAQRVTTWIVGAELGARLRDAAVAEGGTVAPHVRRAHWHTYWLGSEARRDRRRELRWVSPILVGGGADHEHERKIK